MERVEAQLGRSPNGTEPSSQIGEMERVEAQLGRSPNGTEPSS